MKAVRFSHTFVDEIPMRLEDGVVYASLEFATCVHLCACGCGVKVITPLAPGEWSLTFDGRSISLSPSIGNWSFPCRSHYWIRGDRAVWAPRWSDADVRRMRRREGKRRSPQPREHGTTRVGFWALWSRITGMR